jgi:Ni,Fe-hydrogenase I large subunit
MVDTITISPVTRIEGHLSIHAETEPLGSGEKAVRVKSARCEGEMFRGLEKILEGRDPLDAQVITQRTCGVCPITHGVGSVRAQEMAYGITPNRNGRLLQNLILAANYLHSHILHLYQLAALDFVDIKAILKYAGSDRLLLALKGWVERTIAAKDVFPAAPFLPRYESDSYVKDLDVNVALLAHYVQALSIRKICDEMGAVFGARLPHSTALVPGGCTQVPTMERVLAYSSRLTKVIEFIESTYFPDIVTVAKAFPAYWEIGRGSGNLLCYGVFENDESGNKAIRPGTVIDGKWEALDVNAITEDVGCSWFSSSSGLHPSKGETTAAPGRTSGYSWIKAPRYRGQPMEVGPLARVLVNYRDPNSPWMKKEVDELLGALKLEPAKLQSVLGRHAARGLETRWLAQQAKQWLGELEIDGPPAREFKIPKTGAGYGLTEAPRGALGHWLSIEDYRIKRYQCIVPTTWNCSPRDDAGKPGPVEQALVGIRVEDPQAPIEVGRIVRSFDPCIACAVH